MNTENNFKIDEKRGLSEYSWGLINDTKAILTDIFSYEKNTNDEIVLNQLAINKEIILTSLIALLKDMDEEERKKFRENSRDLKTILLQSSEKIQLADEEKKEIKEKIESLSPEDLFLPGNVIDKLDLLNLDGVIRKMSESLYKSFKEIPEVFKAHAYINLTQR